ncbi:SurA N-terminal domain-containing protein [Streptomyces sp. NPDC005438]|uniref:SurA N-terminal domain-containing protein n=1 Tax=Streptomyces sp. NPDC005438 TaxID=3156880 RepID=UPI0033B20331
MPARSTLPARSVLPLSAATALLLAAPLLTGCGNDSHTGAAAVWDSQRISMDTLESRVTEVRNAQRSSPQSESLMKDSGQLGRGTLYGLLHARVVERAAKDNGVTASRRDVQSARAMYEQGEGGPKAFRAMLLQQGIAPARIDDAVRTRVLQNKLAAKWKIKAQDQQGMEKLNQRLARVSAKMKINVNPRYGRWDSKQLALGASKEPWVKDVSTSRQPQGQA